MAARLEWLAAGILAAVALGFTVVAWRERSQAWRVAVRLPVAARSSTASGRTAVRRMEAVEPGETGVAAARSALEALEKRERWMAFLEWEAEALEQIRAQGGDLGGLGPAQTTETDLHWQSGRSAAQRNGFSIQMAKRFLEGLDKYDFAHALTEEERGTLDVCRAAWLRWQEACASDEIAPADFAAAYVAVQKAARQFVGGLIGAERQALGMLSSGEKALLNIMFPVRRGRSSVIRFNMPDGEGGRVIYEFTGDELDGL